MALLEIQHKIFGEVFRISGYYLLASMAKDIFNIINVRFKFKFFNNFFRFQPHKLNLFIYPSRSQQHQSQNRLIFSHIH